MRWLALMALLCAAGQPLESAQAEDDAGRDQAYLLRAAMVLEGTRRLVSWLERHPRDPALARFAYPVAEQYVELAGHATPSRKLAVAHPHLLLIAENTERAVDAAAAGDRDGFRQRARTVLEEFSVLENVLQQLKVKLPEPPR